MLISFLTTACPESAIVSDLVQPDCFENFGTLSKLIFTSVDDGAGTRNEFIIASENPLLKATWTAREVAVDYQKVQYSPLLENSEWSGGEKREYGGGDETLGGIPYALGSEFTGFTSRINAVSQDVIAAMKAYRGKRNIGVILVNDLGQLGGQVDNVTTPTKLYPIPLYQFFVTDKVPGKRSEPDYNMVSGSFLENWSDTFKVFTPTDFNGVIDLKNIA